MSTPNAAAGGDQAADYAPQSAANPTVDDFGHRRDILIVACCAIMAVIAAVSGLNVARAKLAIDLAASHGEVLWIISIYAITLAALLLPLGAVGDRRGRKS
jgi:MFS family permease